MLFGLTSIQIYNNMVTVKKDLIECAPDIGLAQLEMMVRAKGGIIIKINKSNRYWHVTYRV